jgi:hypothetical protein
MTTRFALARNMILPFFAGEELAAVLRAKGQSASAVAVFDTGARIAHAVHEDSTYMAIHNAWRSATLR